MKCLFIFGDGKQR